MKKIIVVGGGAAGIAAAQGALDAGADSVWLIDRNKELGGILRQCIHDGFGLNKYKASMTGPEYAVRSISEIYDNPRLHISRSTNVIGVKKHNDEYQIQIQNSEGLKWVGANSIVFATGCREKTRGMLMIPGTRPAGIFTAGLAQRLVNIENVMPGKRVVILGSGDIGLIMARRLCLEGAEVAAVIEIMKDSGGLSRNIRQCLLDFDIPLYTGHTVSKIIGRERVQAVEICEVDDNLSVKKETAQIIDCDTLILSVGLIPENEILSAAGAELCDGTENVKTDSYLQTSLDGVFLCGNSRYVHDLVDRVSAEGYAAGQNAALFIKMQNLIEFQDPVTMNAIKGIPQKTDVFCVLCPNGCRIKVDVNEKGERNISGNGCPKGVNFVEQESKTPSRIVTTTVKGESGRLIPVKSSLPISLDKAASYVKECQNMILSKNDLKEDRRIRVAGFPDAIGCYD